MTPSTRPALALPTDRNPVAVSVIPVGSGAPSDETPNTPPFRTPAGSVVDRSKVVPVPLRKYGVGLTAQSLGALGGGGVGVGAGAGGEGWPGSGLGTGPGCAEASCAISAESFQLHPEARLEAPSRPNRRTLRRDIRFITPSRTASPLLRRTHNASLSVVSSVSDAGSSPKLGKHHPINVHYDQTRGDPPRDPASPSD